jgi:phage tail-like protein
MPLPELDTSVGHSFGLEIDGIVIKAIQEVSGLKMEQDVIELKHNTPDGKYINKKLPGRAKSGEITLTRGLTEDTSFEKWIKTAHLGKMGDARKGGAVIVYDYEGQALKRYKLTNMWAKSLEIGAMKAGDTNLLTEKLTVTYEALEPES